MDPRANKERSCDSSSSGSIYSAKSKSSALPSIHALGCTTSVNPADYVWGVPSPAQQRRLHEQFTELAVRSGAACCPALPVTMSHSCYHPSLTYNNMSYWGTPSYGFDAWPQVNTFSKEEPIAPGPDAELWSFFEGEDDALVVPALNSVKGKADADVCLSSNATSAISEEDIASMAAGFVMEQQQLKHHNVPSTDDASRDPLDLDLAEFDHEFEMLNAALSDPKLPTPGIATAPLSGNVRKCPDAPVSTAVSAPKSKKARSSETSTKPKGSSTPAGDICASLADTVSSIIAEQLAASEWSKLKALSSAPTAATSQQHCHAVPQFARAQKPATSVEQCRVVPQMSRVPSYSTLPHVGSSATEAVGGCWAPAATAAMHTPLNVFPELAVEERDTFDELKNVLCSSYDSCSTEDADWDASLMLRFEEPGVLAF